MSLFCSKLPVSPILLQNKSKSLFKAYEAILYPVHYFSGLTSSPPPKQLLWHSCLRAFPLEVHFAWNHISPGMARLICFPLPGLYLLTQHLFSESFPNVPIYTLLLLNFSPHNLSSDILCSLHAVYILPI